MPRPTVNDIARTAGVSLATVDRVLNGRPGVRPATIGRVREAVDALGYVRDVTAANLARQRQYRMLAVIPRGTSAFLRALSQALGEAALWAARDRTRLEVVEVPAHDAHALRRALDAVDPLAVDGIAILAEETPPLRDALARLHAAGVAVVAIVSDLPNAPRDHFVGINNLAAGRTAGDLLGRFLAGRAGAILVVANSMLSRDAVERRLGFDAVLAERFPRLRALPTIEAHDDAGKVEALLGPALDRCPDAVGVYSLGAGTRGLLRAVEARGLGRELAVVVHDLTPHVRAGLERGIVDVAIAQDVGHIVRSALRVLRARCDGTDVVTAQERIRIEIMTRENLP